MGKNLLAGLSATGQSTGIAGLVLGSLLLTPPVTAQNSPVAEDLRQSSQWQVLDQYCIGCHNLDDFSGGLALDLMNEADFHSDAMAWEKVVRKLRTGLMPPAGEARPDRTTLDGVAGWLETRLDAVDTVNPGTETISRLNRAEYANAVRDLLAFDASAIVSTLPEDAIVEGFDNIAEMLTISPSLLEGYLAAAMEISRQAVGDRSIGATDIHYYRGGSGAQTFHIDGQPLGTRGGMIIEHHFPVDAEYVLRIGANLQQAGWHNDEHRMWWCNGPQVEVAFNGVRVPVTDHRNFRVQVPAGKHQIAVSLLDEKACAGVVELYLGEALASVGGAIQEIEIQGPFNVSGVHDTPSRNKIFICRPLQASEESGCARDILSNLASLAYRRPVYPTDPEIDTLMILYDLAREVEAGDFELGIQYAISRLLVDPQFLYRFEEEPNNLRDGDIYRISDLELASRLSFFLWSSIPDEELLNLALDGRLREPTTLSAQVERMLDDQRAQALVDNFAGQWLKLRELDEALPQDPAFDDELKRAFRLESELLFTSILREQRSVLTLLDADYTYVNERLAQHYGMPAVRGSYMRQVSLPADSPRRGLLGQGSILTATSNPNGTSPVNRGVWVVENLLGAPVPLPPPGVETDLSAVATNQDLPSTLRARLEQHRDNPTCSGCHGMMDPVGLALENFDLTGRWRDNENGLPLDTASVMVDGTVIDGPGDLRRALLARQDSFLTAFTESLLSYALGRHVEYFDGPSVRKILRQAANENYTFQSLVHGITTSEPFQKKMVKASSSQITLTDSGQ